MFLLLPHPRHSWKVSLISPAKYLYFVLINISPFPDQNYFNVPSRRNSSRPPPPTQGRHEPNPLKSVIENWDGLGATIQPVRMEWSNWGLNHGHSQKWLNPLPRFDKNQIGVHWMVSASSLRLRLTARFHPKMINNIQHQPRRLDVGN